MPKLNIELVREIIAEKAMQEAVKSAEHFAARIDIAQEQAVCFPLVLQSARALATRSTVALAVPSKRG